MSRLFISHSSRNNAEAAGLNVWLREQGWDDVFLDVTPDRGIAAGERWERALNEAASRCEAVLFLISRDWLGSGWCRKEYDLARRLNKRLFGALIEPIPIDELPPDITGTFQTLDLASGQDHVMIRAEMPRTHEEVHVTFSQEGLARLKSGLSKAGLDPRFFPWPPEGDPGRAPYRGLKPLEREDAGIFFGRDAPIIEGVDTLRGLAEAAAPRLLAILGASGAGKSSFLRAGLLPRLARDDRAFLVLPVLRPEGGALTGETGLLAVLEGALASARMPQSRASIRAALAEGATAVKPLLARLAAQAFRQTVPADGVAKAPVITLAIDQAEELFGPDPENEALLALVRDLVAADDPAVIVLFTIRSDAYDRLETAKALEGLRQRTLPLLPMPRGAYQTVIEGPAARLAGSGRSLAIEPRLTGRLLQDIEAGGGSDALPLLAFTLGQLFLDFGGAGALKLADYEAFGGIRGAIEAAVRRAMAAADRDGRIPSDPEARFLLLRRGLIPWLAGIDPETGSPRRRLARFSDIPADAEPLVRLLVEQRLLSLDRVTTRVDGEEVSEVTIEPAHEALLRQWGLLRGWLVEDFASLSVLDAVKRATREWDANARGAEWLDHSGTRLIEAESVAARDDLGADLNPAAREYLRLCRARDDAAEAARKEALHQERELAESRLRLAEADRHAADATAAAARRFIRLAVGATAAVALFVLLAGAMAALTYLGAQERAAALAAADDARAAAEAARWVAKSQGELRDGNPVEAVRSAARAYRDRPREETRSALLAALLEIPNLRGTLKLPDGPPQAMTWLSDDVLGFASQIAPLRVIGGTSDQGRSRPTSPPIPGLSEGSVFVRAMRPLGDGMVAILSNGSVVSWKRGDPGVTTLVAAVDTTVVDSAAIGPAARVLAFAANGEGATAVPCEVDRSRTAGRTCKASRITDAPVRAVAVSSADEIIALGDDSGMLSFAAGQGALSGPQVALGSGVVSVAIAPDGRLVAAGTASGEVVLVQGGQVRLRASFSTKPVGTIGFAPTGTLAFSCGDASVCLWRIGRTDDGAIEPGPVSRLSGHQGSATALSWRADRLATAFADGLVRFWSADAPGEIGTRLFPDRPADLLRVATLAKAPGFAAGGTRGTIFVWDRPDAPPRKLDRDSDREVRSIAPGPDGRIAAAFDDGAVAIWPAGGGEAQVKRWDANAHPGLAWLEGGRRLAVALADGRVVLHEPATGQDSFLPALGPNAEPWGLAASSDGRALFVSHVGGTIRRWDVAARTVTSLRDGAGLPEAERGGPESLSASPDGRWIAVTGDDDHVRLFDTAGDGRRALPTESAATRTVAFSPDGRRLAALGADGRVYLWTVDGTAFTRHLSIQPPSGEFAPGPARPTNWLAWAGPDTLILASPSGSLQLVPLDEAAWARRAAGLDLVVQSP